MDDTDHIGAVREHRWASLRLQRERLNKDGCRVILDLDRVPFSDLVRLTRSGTVIKVLFPFLLADPSAKRKAGGLRKNFHIVLKRLACKSPHGQEGIVKDVSAGISTADRMQKQALIKLAEEHIAASGKGAKSVLNGAKNTSQGRRPTEFTADQHRDAKAAWRNLKDYPTWDDVKKALPDGFTVYRAHKLWGARK